MGEDIGLGWVCFDFHHGAALHYLVCRLWLENDLRQQSVTEPELMPSPSLVSGAGRRFINL